MADAEPFLVPVVRDGIIVASSAAAKDISVTLADGSSPVLLAIGQTGQLLIEQRPDSDLRVMQAGAAPLAIQVGGWSGRVDRVQGGVITGWARNLRCPGQNLAILAYTQTGVKAVATSCAAEGGRFLMVLPPQVTGAGSASALTLGIAGSDYVLEGGELVFQPRQRPAAALCLTPRPLQDMAIRIKISTPSLKEAPMWGDFHFANSLAAAFERIGQQATVDTADMWYQQSQQEDVVLSIRGRHRVKVDRSKVNIMWIISHPDRIPEDEYTDYDHIAVASDVYAEILRARGVPSVSVLHQAADATLFRSDPTRVRKASSLFVGNSRREYRTMVKWCIQKQIALDLYGGGWEGVLPQGSVRGTSVANADLPRLYGAHLILLNDHWDSMREFGFLSNRLFDGSAVATPLLTDPVVGLADVFGDTISVAADIDQFAAIIEDCLDAPTPYLERAMRAHDIVQAAHTFDHRAAELARIIDVIAARKRLTY